MYFHRAAMPRKEKKMKYKMVIGGFTYWCIDFITGAGAWEYANKHRVSCVKKVLHPNGDFYRVVIERAY